MRRSDFKQPKNKEKDHVFEYEKLWHINGNEVYTYMLQKGRCTVSLMQMIIPSFFNDHWKMMKKGIIV